MFTAWIQGQMSDLIIFKKNPQLIPNFINNLKTVPKEFHEIRICYWEKQFGSVKTEFKEAFSDLLTNEEKNDVEEIYYLRNMIAHAHVSVGREYMLYRPSGGLKREQQLIDDLRLQPIEDQFDPVILKIELWRNERFAYTSNLIERFDQKTLKRISDSLGIPHGRIR